MNLDPIVCAAEIAGLEHAVILDCRPDLVAYRSGHIPRARHAQLERDLSSSAPQPARGGRHPLPELRAFAETLGRWGITPRSHVVAYDDQDGANAAARLWWLLTAVGQPRVQVVDGGLAALIAAGFELTTAEPAAEHGSYSTPSSWQRPLAEIAEVERARQAHERCVIDVRAGFRYRGEREPIDPIAGHIPGAVNLPLSENLRADGSWKSPDELRALYVATLGRVAPEHAIVHCGSGVTACHTLLALERAGLPGAKLYVGSWSEWCRNPDREREP